MARPQIKNKEANKLGVKVVAVGFVDYAQWFTTKKLLKRPADFKGARLRTYPGYVSDAVKTLNAMADKLLGVFKQKTLVTGPKELKEKGMKIHVQTPEEMAVFKKALKPVYDMYLEKAGTKGKKALGMTR